MRGKPQLVSAILGVGFVAGVAISLATSSGCIYPDTCNGLEIDGLEAGLDVYIDNQHADVLDVCISRDGRWLHMHYTFVS